MKKILSVLLITILTIPLVTHASLVTFDFEGAGLAGPQSLPRNTGFSGNYSFEAEQTPVLVAKGGGYVSQYELTSFSLTSEYGSLSYNSGINVGRGTIGVYNNLYESVGFFIEDDYKETDGYSVTVYSEQGSLGNIGGENVVAFFLVLTDTSASVFSGEALPITPPRLSDFDFTLVVIGLEGENVGLGIRLLDITSLTLAIVPVPVPTTIWLFGSGLLGLIGMKRKPSKFSA